MQPGRPVGIVGTPAGHVKKAPPDLGQHSPLERLDAGRGEAGAAAVAVEHVGHRAFTATTLANRAISANAHPVPSGNTRAVGANRCPPVWLVRHVAVSAPNASGSASS